ncbi:MAG: SDR family NAD(P)-dependent oxidoreductase, partial [Nitrososphaera sp.]|nr:SDR family NAD(P)-dependent oxidoreductase [Nitrososphaera sp.]
MNLQGQVAILTGASSGIGAAVARDLNEAGMKLVLTARRADRLQKLSSELKEAIYIAGEITEVDLPQRLLDRALDTFGRCDVVFNNAGLIEVGPIDKIDIN